MNVNGCLQIVVARFEQLNGFGATQASDGLEFGHVVKVNVQFGLLRRRLLLLLFGEFRAAAGFAVFGVVGVA